MEIENGMVQNDENWQTLCRFFPDNWRHKAFELGACKRLRGYGSLDVLMRMLLLHLADGISLRQTCAIARQAGWANVSDVSLLKRLRQASQWFRWLARQMLHQAHGGRMDLQRPPWLAGRRVKSIDATVVSEPGSTGTDWRFHYCLELFELQCEQVVLTDHSVGEKVSNFHFSPGDVVVGDRVYCSGKSIQEFTQAKADWVLRYRHTSLGLFEDAAREQDFDLFGFLGGVKQAVAAERWLWSGKTPVQFRLIAIRKSKQAAEQARKDYIYNQRRKKRPVTESTLYLQDYIIVLSNLKEEVSASQVLMLYRLRWQIEVAFKRLKSILGLGHLPKQDPQSCRAWLHGKLFIALLVERMVEEARLFSPWGYPLPEDRSSGPELVSVAGS